MSMEDAMVPRQTYDEGITARLGYVPGKSATPVSARRKDPRAALAETDAFLTRHAHRSMQEPVVLIANSDESLMHAGAASAGRTAAHEHFGEPIRGSIWYLEGETVDSAIELVLKLGDRWPGALPPLSLHLTWRFIWKDLFRGPEPVDLRSPAWRDRSSRLGVHLLYRSRVGFVPALDFPFAWEAPGREAFVEALRADCPFPIRGAHFRRVLRRADGGWGNVRTV